MVVKKVNEINLKIPLIFFFCFITLYFVYLFFQLLKKMITQSTGYFWFTQSFLPSCIFCDQLIFYNLSKALCYFWFFLWNKVKQMQKGFYGRTKVTCPDLKSGIRRWERRGGGVIYQGPLRLAFIVALHQNVDRRHRFRPAPPSSSASSSPLSLPRRRWSSSAAACNPTWSRERWGSSGATPR